MSRADLFLRENTLDSVRTAAALVPANAAYHAMLGEHLEAAGANPDGEFELAAQLSPRQSRYWIRRGFRAEVEQKYEDSQRYLLQAHKVDHGFDPWWALTNYYFRRGMQSEFWESARETLRISYNAPDPIFRLCLATNSDPSVTRQYLPPRRDLLFAFFTYLLKQSMDASALAPEIAAGALPEEAPVLTDFSEMEAKHDDKSGLLVWNAMCSRHLIPFKELSPNDGRLITNGDFSAVPSQRGFDWRYQKTEGIASKPADSAGISFELTGNQPDHAIVLEQTIPIEQEKRYTIGFEYRLVGSVGGSIDDSGLHWMVHENERDGVSAAEPVAVSQVLTASDWHTGQVVFVAGRHNIASLRLDYRRTSGTVRWRGTVQIRRVSSDIVQAGSAK